MLQNSAFSNNANLQNLLILTAIKSDQSRVKVRRDSAKPLFTQGPMSARGLQSDQMSAAPPEAAV